MSKPLQQLLEVATVVCIFGIIKPLKISIEPLQEFYFIDPCHVNMVGHTVVEIIGHIIYSFTRSVAEHYNFRDEADQNSHLLGYNPLDDTGLEWYCQPVDDLIYQEYSNSDATKFDYLESSRVHARLIDACSTEDSEPTQDVATEDTAMAWKRLRPSIFRSLWKSFYFGFLISVLSAAMVAIVSILIYYLSYQTLLKCESFSTYSVPEKLQWMKTTSEVIACSVYFYWFFLNTLFYFRSFQISGLPYMLALLRCRCSLSNLFSSFWNHPQQVDKYSENPFDSSVFSLRLPSSVYDCEASLPRSQKDALSNVLVYYNSLYPNLFHGCFHCLYNLPSL